MKQYHFPTAVPALFAAMGVVLSWTNLRFPGTIPSGFKLCFLLLLIDLWLIQIVGELFSETHPTHKLNLFCTGIAVAFYGLNVFESIHLFRLHNQSVEAWLFLVFSLLAAFIVTVFCLAFNNSGMKCESEK